MFHFARIFAILSLFCLFATGCATNLPAQSPGAAQASHDTARVVALVSDFGNVDPAHHTFCSGVWVSSHQIMTAAHCVLGYANELKTVQLLKALEDQGVPPFIAQLLANLDLSDVTEDSDAPDVVKAAAAIARALPPVKPLGLDLPYIVPSEVTDPGYAPTAIHHTAATWFDKDTDLALLETQGVVPVHQPAQLADHTPPVGDTVTSMGSPHGSFFSFRLLTVSAYRHTEKGEGMDITGPFMQVNGSVVGGDSGSGVFDSHGYLVGIISFADSRTSMGYCLHLESLRQVLIGQHLLAAHLDVKAKDPDLGGGFPLNLQ